MPLCLANAVESALFERRSIRRYTDRVVDRAAVEHLLQAAVRAPSAMDAQPWSFAIYQGRALLEAYAGRAARHIARSLFRGGPRPLVRAYLAAEGRQLFHGASTLTSSVRRRTMLTPWPTATLPRIT